MESIYKIVGLSKQAVHKHMKREKELSGKLSALVLDVDILRENHPGCGVEKMYTTLKPNWIGRDKFIELFMDLGYRVKKIRNYIKTTIPVHSKYKNLIQGLMVVERERVWQTDITYFQVGNRFYYIVFIIDIYSRKIVGYKVSDHLRAQANICALKMALKNCITPIGGLIHHSDRGSQYIDGKYTKLLKDYGVHISMGHSAQDNAYAERINGTIKNEYLRYWEISSFKGLQTKVKEAVMHYKKKRGHKERPNSMSPIAFENYLLNLGSQKRPMVIIYANGNYKIKKASNLLYFKPKEEPLAHNCPIAISVN